MIRMLYRYHMFMSAWYVTVGNSRKEQSHRIKAECISGMIEDQRKTLRPQYVTYF